DPANGGKVYVNGTTKYALSSYLGNTGRNYTDWRTTGDTGVLHLYPSQAGVKLQAITDGTSNTLLIGERPPSTAGSGTNPAIDGYWGWWLSDNDYDTSMWAMAP